MKLHEKKTVWALVFMLTAFSFLAGAQDVIVLHNGDEIKAKVEEVGTDEVRYRKFENPSGPVYTIKRADVFMIRYESGGRDVFNQQTQQTSAPQTTSAGTSGDELPRSSFNINPLGLLQFGPIFQYEGRVGERLYITPYFRYAYAGVLTHLLWTGFEEESALSPASAGVGFGLKSFAASTGNTWYYGGALDIHWTKANYDIGEEYETEEKGIGLAPVFNVGHRWRSDHKTYVNVGLFAGVGFPLNQEERYVGTGELESTGGETTIFAMFELSFGWEH